MSIVDTVKNFGLRATGPIALKLQRRAPEILTAVGVTGLVATGALLIRQTITAGPIIEAHKKSVDTVKAYETDAEYTEEVQKAEIARTYISTGFSLAKHYGPTVILGAASVGAILTSQGILRRRNVALAAAYQAVQKSYDDYRKRVSDTIGEEPEEDIYRGIRTEEVVDEETGETKTVATMDPNGHSIYAKFFDELSARYNKIPEYNLMFLRQQENYFNDRLRIRGYVFLNEVYDALDIPKTQIGQQVGWSLDKDGDGFIDFGIYEFNSPESRAFVNGMEAAILLDFNVDGAILDVVPFN